METQKDTHDVLIVGLVRQYERQNIIMSYKMGIITQKELNRLLIEFEQGNSSPLTEDTAT